MLRLKEQKHLIYYDDIRSYFASFTLQLQRAAEGDERDKNNDIVIIKQKGRQAERFSLQIKIRNQFKYEWHSDKFNLQQVRKACHFGECPFSLENYFQIYQDPNVQRFEVSLKSAQGDEEMERLYGQVIGKLIISTCFGAEVFRLPVNIVESSTLVGEIQKTVSVIAPNLSKQSILCSGTLVDTRYYGDVSNFISEQKFEKEGFVMKVFMVEERVQAQHVVVLRGSFNSREFVFDKATIRIYNQGQEVFFMPGLLQHLQQIKTLMGEVESLSIIQNMDTGLEDGHRLVFYSDLSSLYSRIYRSYLYDKIKDKWLIEGMVSYNRSNKHFQDVIRELMDLMTQGEELLPLQEQTFYFDRVWRLKAVFLYHVLSNFKTMRDYGSSSLANLIIEEARRTKITSQVLFKRLKNKYGLKNFRTIYEQQFVKSTGLSRIFYEIIDVKKENRVKIIVRQKALANKVFRLYNMFRIKLQQQYGCISQLMQKIINKNKFLQRKKELSGPLAVPKFLKCLPYFRGHVAVETDASEMPFELELREENIIEEKQNVTSKIRAPLRKTSEADKSYEGFEWIMIDTAYIFPAMYKNENVHESVILQKIKRRYDSEHEEIKVLNCVSSRDHSGSQKICRALIEKVRINPNAKENCSINVKRKVLQILPVFLSKATDFSLWEDVLEFLKLYEPICHDYSEEGYQFLLSIIQSLGEIEYKKQFSYYFEQFHRIMLVILRELNERSEEREERLKMAIFNSLMKWCSRYSIEILEEVVTELRLSRFRVRQHLCILKVIFENIFGYLNRLRLSSSLEVVQSLISLVSQVIARDSTFALFAIKFSFEIGQKEKELIQPLPFLKYVFSLIQTYKQQNLRKFGLSLQALKNQLNRNKKVYGLQMQLSLSQNENYFIAEYLWKELTSSLSGRNQFIRLQWIKIYRIFYFYFIPVITLKKIRNNVNTHEFGGLSEQAAQDILTNLKDFFPDIKWFSGYDSRSAKELKAKYEQMNENKRKKKFEEYSFSENNVITMFIRQHPGRQSWDELAREAIRIFISIYEDKEQRSEGREAQRFKAIQEGFKKIETKLKRGRMPDFYNYQQLKEEIGHLMQEYREEEKKISDILVMVDRALADISQEKSRREVQLRDEMRIIINLDSIHEEEDEQGQEEEGQGEVGDDELLFGEDEQEGAKQDQRVVDEGVKVEAERDEDEMIFGMQ